MTDREQLNRLQFRYAGAALKEIIRGARPPEVTCEAPDPEPSGDGGAEEACAVE